jgi:hypothetical protein
MWHDKGPGAAVPATVTATPPVSRRNYPEDNFKKVMKWKER